MGNTWEKIKEFGHDQIGLPERYKKLTLLHSNDLHGDFLAEDVDGELVGGISRLSGHISKTRAEDPNVLYAISGDMLRGSVIDSEFKGISTIEIMNLLSPNVVTIGNHEIDYGVAHLLFIEKCANFPIVNANFYIRHNGRRLFEPQCIVDIGGMRVLFIGIVTEEVIAAAKGDTLIGTFLDIGEATREVGRICNAYNATDVDCTVLLTHIGYEEDKKLAEMLDPDWGVDLIIGGHSHTKLEEPTAVNGIPIVQVGMGTDQIGRFDIVVDTKRNRISSYDWHCIPINDKTCPRDEALEELILNFKGKTDEKFGRVLTRLQRELTHPARNQETELGNLISDILTESLGVDLMLLGSGSIRLEQMGPIVTLGDLNQTFPYDDPAYSIHVTGAQLRRALAHMLRDEAFSGEHTEFYQLPAGTHIVYNRDTKSFEELYIAGEPLREERIYTLGLQKFHFENAEDFLLLNREDCAKNGASRTLTTSVRDVIEEYLCSHNNLDSRVEGRLVIKGGVSE